MNKSTLKTLKITTIIVLVALVVGSIIYESHLDFLISGLISLVVTYIAYFGYPFIRTKFMHVKYNKKTCNRMAIWNSIIVGCLFAAFTGGGAVAFLYYLFNRTLWISEEEELEEMKKQSVKIQRKDSSNNIRNKQNVMVQKQDKIKCPYCKKSNIKIRGNILYCLDCDESFTIKKTKPNMKKKIEKAVSNENVVKEIDNISKKAEQDVKIQYCNQCGTKLDKGSKFCKYCGNKIV